MPKPAAIEDAPHHLQVLHGYGKTAVALALALLSLSVAFAEKLLKSPVDGVQAVLLGLIWACLIGALLSGLLIIARVTDVAYYYIKALRIAYPDALWVVATGARVKGEKPGEEDQATGTEERGQIKTAISTSSKQTLKAYWWANCSFLMFACASALIGGFGIYGLIYRSTQIDASGVVAASVNFTTQEYRIAAADAQLRSLTYDAAAKKYTVEINHAQATNEKYTITIDGMSGNVIKAAKTP